MKNLLKSVLVSLAIFSMLPAGAGAAQQTGRYILKQTSDGFMRLDTETGSVAHCTKRNNKWHCDGVSAGQTSQDPEIARLKQQNKELNRRIARLETKVRTLTSKARQPKTKLGLPSDQELDEVMGFFEKLMSRFMQFARTLQGPSSEDI